MKNVETYITISNYAKYNEHLIIHIVLLDEMF